MLSFLRRSTVPVPPIQDTFSCVTLPSQSSSLDQLMTSGFTFPIDKSLESPATKVMFNTTNPILRDICLKTWLACENALYSTSNLSNCTIYLLDGLYFNRRFAPDVYVGIAPVLSENGRSLTCGPLIKEPQLASIKINQPYVLVMKRLDDSSRLDHQLKPSQLGNIRGMEFLAKAIVTMHRRVDESPREFGTVDDLRKKLQVNRQLFQESLRELPLKEEEKNKYAVISDQMEEFFATHADLFQKRYANKPAMRCHGDLKAVNLWIATDSNLPPQSRDRSRRLLTLDCIDFRPDFCHIDTLSDVAMLAVDLEMRLTFTRGRQNGRRLAEHFLSTYLKDAKKAEETRNADNVQPLLEYYMTEKAMVGALMSIHFDSLPSLGEKYLKVALVHAAKLEKYLLPKITLQAAPTALKNTPLELNLQPVSVIEQIDTTVPIFDQVLVPSILA